MENAWNRPAISILGTAVTNAGQVIDDRGAIRRAALLKWFARQPWSLYHRWLEWRSNPPPVSALAGWRVKEYRNGSWVDVEGRIESCTTFDEAFRVLDGLRKSRGKPKDQTEIEPEDQTEIEYAAYAVPTMYGIEVHGTAGRQGAEALMVLTRPPWKHIPWQWASLVANWIGDILHDRAVRKERISPLDGRVESYLVQYHNGTQWMNSAPKGAAHETHHYSSASEAMSIAKRLRYWSRIPESDFLMSQKLSEKRREERIPSSMFKVYAFRAIARNEAKDQALIANIGKYHREERLTRRALGTVVAVLTAFYLWPDSSSPSYQSSSMSSESSTVRAQRLQAQQQAQQAQLPAPQRTNDVTVDNIDSISIALADKSFDSVKYTMQYADFGGGYYIPNHVKIELNKIAGILLENERVKAYFIVNGYDIMAATTRTSESVQTDRSSIVRRYVVSRGVNRHLVSNSGRTPANGGRFIEVIFSHLPDWCQVPTDTNPGSCDGTKAQHDIENARADTESFVKDKWRDTLIGRALSNDAIGKVVVDKIIFTGSIGDKCALWAANAAADRTLGDTSITSDDEIGGNVQSVFVTYHNTCISQVNDSTTGLSSDDLQNLKSRISVVIRDRKLTEK